MASLPQNDHALLAMIRMLALVEYGVTDNLLLIFRIQSLTYF
jgi:hypothetical protein